MNKTKILYFLAGVVTGTIGTIAAQKAAFFLTHNKYEIKEPDFDISEYDIEPEDEVFNKSERSEMSDDERAEIKEKLDSNLERTTHYATMYRRRDFEEIEIAKENGEKLDDETANEIDSIVEEENMDENQTGWQWDIEANEDHQKNRNKPPRIISYEATLDLPDYIDHRDLRYYYNEGALVNDEGETLDPDIFTGDCLYKFGFDSNPDEELIYVMNYRLDTCYAVHKDFGDYIPSEK